MAKILLDRGADFKDGAFVRAVDIYETHPVFLNTLLQRNGNADAYTQSEGSALHVAANSRSEESFQLLLGKGAYIDAATDQGSVLLCSIVGGMFNCARSLLLRERIPTATRRMIHPFPKPSVMHVPARKPKVWIWPSCCWTTERMSTARMD